VLPGVISPLAPLKNATDMLKEVKNQECPSEFKIAAECNGLLMYFQSSRFIVIAFIFKHLVWADALQTVEFQMVEPQNLER